MTVAAPPWLAEALPEWVRDYLTPPPTERAGYFAAAFERAAESGAVFHTDGMLVGVEPMGWDTRHFGISCARIAPICVDRACSPERRAAALGSLLDQVLDWCTQHEIRLLLRRMVSARNVEATIFEERGFRIVDVITTLTAPAEDVDDASTRPLVDRDLPSARRIASEAFTHSRFLADPRLDKDRAREVYVHWLDTLATGAGSGEKRGDGAAVLVAPEGDGIAGFIALRRDPSLDPVLGVPLASVELFAVAAISRGRGHGARLLGAAKSWARANGATLVEASTWAASADALRSYRAAGFEMRDSLLSFHCHLD